MSSSSQRAHGRSQLTAINQINVTPLIDLFCLLLIVFMLVVPLLEFSVDVKPPSYNANALPDDKDSVVVNLNSNGDVVLDKQVMSLDQLTSVIKLKNKTLIFLRADGTRQYNEVMKVMKAIKEAGIKEISLVTIQEDVKK